MVLAGALLALLAACGGNSVPPPGTPVITVSTTNTSFASYIVSIDSITMQATDGSFATPLFTPITVDLARVTDIAELLGAPAVPSNTYINAQITLDFSAPVIYGNSATGAPVLLTAQGPGAAVLSSVILTVTFDPAHPLVVVNAQSTHAHLTFDLEAFNTVDLTAKTVTVQPYAVMQPNVSNAIQTRARGVFVVTQDTSFIMNTRPFYDYIDQPSGALFVNVSDKTYYNVNGVVYVGAAGLAAMKDLNISTPIAAFGTLDDLSTITPSFTATSVYVGVALEGSLQDHFVGVVTKRSGDTLTLSNIQALPLQNFSTLATITFLPSATVTVGSGTIVTEDGVDAAGLGLQSISVGQQVDIAGIASTDPNNTAIITMDATAGQVRLQTTRVWGSLKSASPDKAFLDLLTLGGLVPTLFDFAGTATGGGAVSPADYEVNTGTIDESGTAGNTLLAIDGIVAPFGAAPPDFNATAITPETSIEQQLEVEWKGTGTAAPFISKPTAAGFTINLANPALGTLHAIFTGPASLDLKSLPASPLITTVGADQNNLLLTIGSAALNISEYQNAATFTTQVNTLTNGTNLYYRLTAFGHYNSAGNTFVAQRINLALEN